MGRTPIHYITQLKAQGSSRTCNESKEKEKDEMVTKEKDGTNTIEIAVNGVGRTAVRGRKEIDGNVTTCCLAWAIINIINK